ncbi:ATP-binding protein [Nocardiopsis ansamitocini]|uniref:AAA+ ATPase domain-containing protein n=1 Tax=Nocardiopsis ansamitocini TaxID=1670832 RepID=A0A9W6P2C3_9ACTN|nr:ATP-binding protein [Nocardiopsis ansamitocini]GLU45849.1 hypothetical protein Nans01_02000 [Nocardiopsis ansamitocini]
MREPVRYCDAIRILGTGEGRVADLVDRLCAREETDLLDARTELVRFAHHALNRLDREAHRLPRRERTRRIAAAHSMVVVTAFFESLDDTELPFDLDGTTEGFAEDPGGVTDHKQLGEFVALLVLSAPPLPRVQRDTADGLARVRRFYLRRCKQLPGVLRGMPLWVELDEVHRGTVTERLGTVLANRCTRRYEELRDKLAAGFPEFGAWAGLHTARPRYGALPEVPMGLSRLQHRLQSISTGRVPSAVRGALARTHRERLDVPVSSLAPQLAGTYLPPLGLAYVTPAFRATELGPRSLAHEESWWQEQGGPREDLAEFLLGHLTAPRALLLPLVVFGPSGSGKSALVTMLAARLPESDFAAVRVDVRDLPEGALERALADRLSGALLAAGAENCDALPVLLLDGVEELGSRAGVTHSGLLAGVAAFQHARAGAASPVAVVLTCRDSTAARVRFPPGSVAIRLEDFTDAQLGAWLDTWNRINAGYLDRNGALPLDRDCLAPHLPLGRRPLFLLMMAVYDGTSNALRKLSAPLREAGLYERWLRMLADAADRRDRASAPADGDLAVRSGRIEQALLGASVLAFSMFNRGGRHADTAAVTADHTALLHWPAHFARPMDPLQLGCAVPADSWEGTARLVFSHPSLGEYLVARLVAEELAGLAEARIRDRRAVRPTPLDDAFLHALLSFTPLSVSGEVPRFLAERLRLLAPGARDELRLALAELLRAAGRHRPRVAHTGYRPLELGDAAREAAYSANLMLALVAVHGDEVPLPALFGPESSARWRALAHLWKSQLPPEQWASLVHALEVRGTDGALTVHRGSTGAGAQTDSGFTWRESALLADDATQRLLHALEPLVRLFGGDVTARDSEAASDANAVLTLSFGAADADDDALVDSFERAFTMGEALESDDRLRFQVFVLRQLRGQVHRLGARLVPVTTRHVRPIGVSKSARASVRRLAEEHNEHVAAIRDVLAGYT